MGDFRYALRSDDVTQNATWAVHTGTAVSQYESSHIGTDVIARPAKLSETYGSWYADFSSAQRVDAVVLPMYNFQAGLTVRIQGSSTTSFTTPSLNHLITIPAYRDDGFPYGAWQHLATATGYSTGGYRYWRLTVESTNSAAIATKVKLLAEVQTLTPNVAWGAVQQDDRKLIEHETDYGVSSIYDLGISRRAMTAELWGPDTQRDAVRDLWQSTRGRVYPFVVIPDAAENDAWFVRFLSPALDVSLARPDRNPMSVGFQEVSRGLVL